jgi:hypothetical protein
MEINQTIQDKIDNYLQSKMTSEEVKQFENELDQNSTLKENYLTTKAIKQAIKDEILRTRLTQLKNNIAQSPKNKTTSTLPKKLAIAAFSILLLTAIIYFLNREATKETAPTPPKVYEPVVIQDDLKENIEPIKNNEKDVKTNKKTTESTNSKPAKEPQFDLASLASKLYVNPKNIAMIVRGDEDKINDNLVELFENGKYNDCIEKIDQTKNKPNLQYLKAHCYYKLGYFQEAKTIFHAYANDEFSDYHNDSKFYLLLTLLKMNKTSNQEIMDLSKDIIEGKSVYAERVMEVYEEVQR